MCLYIYIYIDVRCILILDPHLLLCMLGHAICEALVLWAIWRKGHGSFAARDGLTQSDPMYQSEQCSFRCTGQDVNNNHAPTMFIAHPDRCEQHKTSSCAKHWQKKQKDKLQRRQTSQNQHHKIPIEINSTPTTLALAKVFVSMKVEGSRLLFFLWPGLWFCDPVGPQTASGLVLALPQVAGFAGHRLRHVKSWGRV